MRRAAELCLLKHATGAILVHNHSHGNLKPSAADADMTHRLEIALNAIGASLTQHILISGNAGVALIHNKNE